MKTALTAALLGCTIAGAIGTSMISVPAAAQLSVFDPSNYAQNVLTAARTLTSINQQIQQLQNEAMMLTNMARNLARVDFPQMQQLQQRLGQIDRLMGQAQGVDFRVDQLEAQLRQLYPNDFQRLFGRDQRVQRARAQLEAAMGGFRSAMALQNEIVTNVRDDAETLRDIVGRSQGAEGSLQAQQATNQLLALAAKQQLQIQQLMAAQFRAESVEQGRRGQIEREARESTRRFLGDGRAYSPRN